ncbi:peptidoglycan DD-metalloendopeptidase family protein [Zavarzinia sp.]|uniref:M23 family metallopeptidase n=1 Tax=Zavarzinia sp. TaxID=2027920 RepID=UPI003BB51E80
MSSPHFPFSDDPEGRGHANPLLETIVHHSYERRARLPLGRFLLSVAVAAGIGLGAGIGVATLISLDDVSTAFVAFEDAPAGSLADGDPSDTDNMASEDSLQAPDDGADPTVEPPAAEDVAGTPEPDILRVEAGDTLMTLLTGSGLSRAEAFDAVETLRPLFNPRDLRVGQEISVRLRPEADDAGAENGGNAPRLAELAFDTDVDRRVRLTRGEDGRLTAVEERTELTLALARVTGSIDDSLFASAARAGLPDSVTTELIRMFSYDVDFQRDIHPGDQFDVLVERHQDPDGRTLKWGDILFARLTIQDGSLPIYRYSPSDDGIPDFFNPKGESVRKALLRTPIDGARISSGFGMRRHPVLGYSKMHKGLDFSAPTGTPILAAGDGVIDKLGRAGSYGNYVRIRHDGKYSTAYAHMSRFARGLKPGSRVRQGQTIGYVGTTGRSTGPHLHYEILTAGHQINPQGVKFQTGRRLTGKDLAAFNARKRKIDGELAEAPVLSAMVAEEKTDDPKRD